MKILVTGAAGFIGGEVLSSLSKSGFEVLGIDNFSPYYNVGMKQKKLQDLGLTELVQDVDITSREQLLSVFKTFNPTHVVHLAAQGGVRASKADPLPYLQTNQLGFLNMLEISEGVGVKKFIYASSSSVYGDNTIAPFRESSLLSAPKSLYALSKLSNEIIASYLPQSETQRIGLRFFTVYGPWGRPDMAIFRLLANSLLKKPFYLTADLNVKRDFTFVADVSRIIQELIGHERKFSEPLILNVAAGKPYSLLELFNLLDSVGIPVEKIDTAPDPLDVKMTNGCTEKLELYGLTVPKTSLQTGITQTYEWMLRQDLEELRTWLGR